MREHAQSRPSAPTAALVVAALVAGSLSACAGDVGRSRRGRHHAPDAADAPSAASAPEAPKAPFADLAAIPSMAIVGELRSSHPVGDLEAVIRANASAAGYGKRGRAPMKEGALLIESLSNERGGAPSLQYGMRKREPGYFPDGGDWEYVVIDAQGKVDASGKLPLCARCHAEAQREHLFEPVAPL
jgi:hypothetical protein